MHECVDNGEVYVEFDANAWLLEELSEVRDEGCEEAVIDGDGQQIIGIIDGELDAGQNQRVVYVKVMIVLLTFCPIGTHPPCSRRPSLAVAVQGVVVE